MITGERFYFQDKTIMAAVKYYRRKESYSQVGPNAKKCINNKVGRVLKIQINKTIGF
jgi:hypothetical protein